MINLQTIKKAHFIGIGGIGVSAIARMFIPRSFSEEGLGSKSSSEGGSVQVSGSDRSPSPITAGLEQLGVKIFYEQKAENITADLDLVVYTIAIPKDHPELARARELGITCLSYPEVLGLISADKFTIAVAGTHGKTTTTAMIAEMMIAADLDPTVIVGSLMMPMHPEDSPLGAAQGESSGSVKLELNDDFAKSLGQFETLEELKAKIKSNLETEEQLKQKDKKRVAIIEEVIKNSDLKIAAILVENEKEKMLAEMEGQIGQMGLKFDDYLSHLKKTRDDLKAGWDQEARQRVAFGLVLNEIAAREKIEAPAEELKNEVDYLKLQYKDIAEERLRQYAAGLIVNEKVFNYLENLK